MERCSQCLLGLYLRLSMRLQRTVYHKGTTPLTRISTIQDTLKHRCSLRAKILERLSMRIGHQCWGAQLVTIRTWVFATTTTPTNLRKSRCDSSRPRCSTVMKSIRILPTNYLQLKVARTSGWSETRWAAIARVLTSSKVLASTATNRRHQWVCIKRTRAKKISSWHRMIRNLTWQRLRWSIFSADRKKMDQTSHPPTIGHAQAVAWAWAQ